MTDGHDQSSNDFAELENPEVIDTVLRRLIVLSYTGLETGVTLTIGTAIISGLIISPDKFFEPAAQDAREAGATLVADYLFQPGVEQSKKTAAQWETAAEGNTPPLPVTIHLRDAVMHSPGGQPFYLGLWRGKLRNIDGFVMGTISEK